MALNTDRARSFFGGPMLQRCCLIAGPILVLIGASLVGIDEPFINIAPLNETIARWNINLYWRLENPVEVLIGLALIVIGVILYGRFFNLPDWLDIQREKFQDGFVRTPWKQSLQWLAPILAVHGLVIFQLAQHRYSTLLVWAWLGTLAVPAILFWKNDRKGEIDLGLHLARADGAWILALFAFAIAVGSFLLDELPAGWIPDEGAFWGTAYVIARGDSKPFFDFGVYSFPMSASMFQAWVMRWAGIDFWGWRFASVLPAAMTVVPLYLLARELFDRRVAVTASLMMIANPYFLAFARLGYNNSQSLFPVTLCLYFLVLALRRNSRFYYWLTGVTAGFGFYTYFAAGLGLVVTIVVVLGIPLLTRERFRKTLAPLGLMLLGALAVMLPRIAYGLSSDTSSSLHYKIWETGFVSAFYGRAIFGAERIAQAGTFFVDNQVEVFYDPGLYGIVLLRGLIRTAAALFDLTGYEEHSITSGLAGPGSAIFLALGFGLAIANFRKPPHFISAAWFAIGLVLLGVLASLPPRPTHLIAVIPAMALLSAIGLVSLLDALIKPTPDHQRPLWLKNITLTGITAVIAAMGLFRYFLITPLTFPPAPDDYLSWLGRQSDKPVTMILVDYTSAIHNPLDESRIKLSPHRVMTLTGDQLKADAGQIKSWKNFIAFIGLSDGREFAEWIAAQIPGARVEPAYIPVNRLRGFVVSDLPIGAAMDIGFAHGLRELWNSPARNIILACAAGAVFLFAARRGILQ